MTAFGSAEDSMTTGADETRRQLRLVTITRPLDGSGWRAFVHASLVRCDRARNERMRVGCHLTPTHTGRAIL